MRYRTYFNLRRSKEPEAKELIRNMDGLQREIYERAYQHAIAYEKSKCAEGKNEKSNSCKCNT